LPFIDAVTQSIHSVS